MFAAEDTVWRAARWGFERLGPLVSTEPRTVQVTRRTPGGVRGAGLGK